MASSVILAGLSLATVGYGGRTLLRYAPQISKNLEQVWKSVMPSTQSWANAKYYRGGFEVGKMSRREAALIMAISSNASSKKVKEAHKRIMLLNHPDRGGSPFVAAKINEAKEVLSRGS